MPLPANFNRWAHLRSVLIRTQNRIVREEFADVGDDNWSPEIESARGSLRTACTIQPTDSAVTATIRLQLFYNVLNSAEDEPWMGLPMHEVNERMSGRPMITLVFYELPQDVAEGFRPVTGEIAFRLMDETSTSITEANLRTIAQRIKSIFGSAGGYRWKKGKSMASYKNTANGYDFRILCRNPTDARSLITDILAIQGQAPDWSKMNYKENQAEHEAFPTLPEIQNILGQALRKPRRRPIAEVRFRYAWAYLPGREKPITLVDLTGTRSRPLVEA